MAKIPERKPRVVPPVRPMEPVPVPADPAVERAAQRTAAPPVPEPEDAGVDVPRVGIAAAGPVSAIVRPAPTAKPELARNTCNICFNAYFPTAGNANGLCRKSAPVHTAMLVPKVVQVPGQIPFEYGGTTNWPIVRPTDWCVVDFTPLPKDVQ